MSRASLKSKARQEIKVMQGGPANVTRGKGLLEVVEGIIDEAVFWGDEDSAPAFWLDNGSTASETGDLILFSLNPATSPAYDPADLEAYTYIDANDPTGFDLTPMTLAYDPARDAHPVYLFSAGDGYYLYLDYDNGPPALYETYADYYPGPSHAYTTATSAYKDDYPQLRPYAAQRVQLVESRPAGATTVVELGNAHLGSSAGTLGGFYEISTNRMVAANGVISQSLVYANTPDNYNGGYNNNSYTTGFKVVELIGLNKPVIGYTFAGAATRYATFQQACAAGAWSIELRSDVTVTANVTLPRILHGHGHTVFLGAGVVATTTKAFTAYQASVFPNGTGAKFAPINSQSATFLGCEYVYVDSPGAAVFVYGPGAVRAVTCGLLRVHGSVDLEGPLTVPSGQLQNEKYVQGTTLRFVQDAEYPPIAAGTFAVDTTNTVACTVALSLGPDATFPSLPAEFVLVAGALEAGKRHRLYFNAARDGKIYYTITALPA